MNIVKKRGSGEAVTERAAGESACSATEDEAGQELVTMAVVKNLLAVQESMMRALFDSVVISINTRVDELVKTVSIKASVEFSQKDIEDLKPVKAKLNEAEGSLVQVQGNLEYLENQSRRNNIRVSGIPEAAGETWEDAENKVKDPVKSTLGLEIEIERAHRVERRKKPGRQLRSNAKQEPRTIVCKLRDWKQREAVIREARRVKPDGLFIAEDLARATLIKRESQIAKMKEAKKAGKTAYFVLDRLVIRDKKTEENDD